MNTEQERAFIEWRTNHDPRKYPAERDAFMAGWDAGRAALQSKDREDAARYRWLRQQRTISDHACVTWNIGHDWVQMDGAELDAAIDHARRIEGDEE